ncbi:Tripartite tricarboxylate transporter TctA family protein [Pseudodesulfovibrio hydrargyri]|uniref:Tripartite tricarboxylate transporter TctA family protein n=1 Tax=Pseudodesulfovibrio hydrargyri TaxID=2125990 RepID=A0A1J5N520_9BACT|nr:tripartite tricarboxylate transporter permease [Pseudodesulfovibrio hydrargyri]OIQ50699.1 Tripartite tricarboxylate transporter TctA family protein [Pseudodesulfovibrio hydrargyri]
MAGIEYILEVLTPLNLMLCIAGIVAGTIIGALPGLSATMAVAVLVPLTFTMHPASALIMLGAIYTGAIYGGSFAAILVNTPGTPSAIATTFDGFPMAKRGDGDLAVTCGTIASVVGGVIGALFLLFFAPMLAELALRFGPVEYFWLALFGLTLISALSEGSLLKGWAGASFGMLCSTVGVAVIGGDVRYTFDSELLLGGIDIVSALIGLYCVPVLLDLVMTRTRHLDMPRKGKGFRLKEASRYALNDKWNLFRSSVLGSLVGILPGAGGSIASLISYSEAKRSSPRSANFGKGEPSGIFCTEAANNATVGGGFIPTLVLGIPGTPPDAVIMGALLVQGVKTGPALFSDEGGIVYTFIFGLLLATLLMFPVGLLIGKYAYRSIATFSKSILVPVIAFMCVVGSFAINNNVGDSLIMVCLGGVGWILNRFGFPPSPIVLGIILGPIAEQGFVQSWLIGTAAGNIWGSFFGRPIAQIIIALIALVVFYPFLSKKIHGKFHGPTGVHANEN